MARRVKHDSAGRGRRRDSHRGAILEPLPWTRLGARSRAGIPWGAEATPGNFKAFVDELPPEAVWAGFATGAMEMPMVAQSVLLGGHVRVGLEDNLYLGRGVLANNTQLVERARSIVEMMGCSIQTPSQARQSLGLNAPGKLRSVDSSS